MQKNVAGQKWIVFAFSDEGGTNPGEPVTGDAAQITANLYLDGSATPNAVDDTNPTELGGGYYAFDITQAESNAENIVIVPASSTANVNVIGVPGAVYTTPANFPDLSVAATNGRVDVASVAGTAQTAGDLAALITTVDTVVDGIQTDLDNGTDGLGAIKADTAAILDDTGTAGVVVAAASKTGYRLSSTGVDDIWDEATSGHVTAGSFGAALPIIRSSTAQAGAATTITLDASASATDDFYNDQFIYILSGTGAGQGRIISDYNGTTKVTTVSTWAVNPDATSVFVITPFGSVPGASAPTAAQVADAVWDEAMADHRAEGSFGTMLQAFQKGTAQAGASASITLDATGASATTDFYKYAVVEIVAGTGIGQSRQITAYNGSTKVATVDPAWTTAPDATSEYVIKGLGIDAATVASIADAVWDEARSGHVTAGTFGEYVLADSTRVSGSPEAADGLKAAAEGTTPLPADVKQWLGTAAATPTVAGVPEVDVTHVGGTAQTAGDLAAAIATVDGNVSDILVDTGTTLPGILGTPVTDLAADIAAVLTKATDVETDTQDIQSRLPASLNNGSISADVQRINDVAVVGDGTGTPFTV